jgi:peroxiredoxin
MHTRNHLAPLAAILALALSAFAANPDPAKHPPAADPAAASAPAKASPAPAPRPGAPAPGFTLQDAAGKSHALSSFRGKWVVLEWVNYDCPFVKKHYGSGNMPKSQKLARGKGVAWLSINSSAPGKQGNFAGTELAKRIADSKADVDGYLLDPDGVVGRLYKAKTTPHMFVIDPQGKVVYAGAIDDKPSTDKADIAGATNYVQAALEAGLAGKPVETASTTPYGCGVKYAD